MIQQTDQKAEAANRLNLNAIKRLDPDVTEILDRASHVVVYKLKLPKQGWEKAEIEGALFIAKRQIYPFFCIVVLNRLGTENHLNFITTEWKYQSSEDESFISYQSSTGSSETFGIWFHSVEEMQKIANFLKEIVASAASMGVPMIERPQTPPPAALHSAAMDTTVAEDHLKQILFTPKQDRLGAIAATPQPPLGNQIFSPQPQTTSSSDLLQSQKRESELALWQMLKTPPSAAAATMATASHSQVPAPIASFSQSQMQLLSPSISRESSATSGGIKGQHPAAATFQQSQQRQQSFSSTTAVDGGLGLMSPLSGIANGSPMVGVNNRPSRQSSAAPPLMPALSAASSTFLLPATTSTLLLPSNIVNYNFPAAAAATTPAKSTLSNVPLQVLRAKIQQPPGGEQRILARNDFLALFVEALQSDAEFQHRLYQEYVRSATGGFQRPA